MPKTAHPPRISTARRHRLEGLRPALDRLYAHYNQREYVAPDPLAALFRYGHPADQEVVGLIAASLAFGNVKTILKSIDVVLGSFPDPANTLPALSQGEIHARLNGFRHRYVAGAEMADLLCATGHALRDYGSLGACLAAHDTPEAPTLVAGLTGFADYLRSHGRLKKNYLLPDPARGSACKRWFMLLRWMVRKDGVDLGHWHGLNPARLVVPVDTHMHRVARGLGLTRRKAADLKTALEITRAFQVICPEDPVRYDFCLTRLGIRADGDMDAFLRETRRRPAESAKGR